MQEIGMSLKGKTMAIEGFGNVGSFAALRAKEELGIKITHISDYLGTLFNAQGISIKFLLEFLAEKGKEKFLKFPDAKPYKKHISGAPVDILVPAAVENTINKSNAAKVKASIIVEAANRPVTTPAEKILYSKGVTILPDILCNSGGVTVSYFEMVQSETQDRWSRRRVFGRLLEIVNNSYERVLEMTKRYKTRLRDGAYLLGVEEVAKALDVRGVQ